MVCVDRGEVGRKKMYQIVQRHKGSGGTTDVCCKDVLSHIQWNLVLLERYDKSHCSPVSEASVTAASLYRT